MKHELRMRVSFYPLEKKGARKRYNTWSLEIVEVDKAEINEPRTAAKVAVRGSIVSTE